MTAVLHIWKLKFKGEELVMDYLSANNKEIFMQNFPESCTRTRNKILIKDGISLMNEQEFSFPGTLSKEGHESVCQNADVHQIGMMTGGNLVGIKGKAAHQPWPKIQQAFSLVSAQGIETFKKFQPEAENYSGKTSVSDVDIPFRRQTFEPPALISKKMPRPQLIENDNIQRNTSIYLSNSLRSPEKNNTSTCNLREDSSENNYNVLTQLGTHKSTPKPAEDNWGKVSSSLKSLQEELKSFFDDCKTIKSSARFFEIQDETKVDKSKHCSNMSGTLDTTTSTEEILSTIRTPTSQTQSRQEGVEMLQEKQSCQIVNNGTSTPTSQGQMQPERVQPKRPSNGNSQNGILRSLLLKPRRSEQVRILQEEELSKNLDHENSISEIQRQPLQTEKLQERRISENLGSRISMPVSGGDPHKNVFEPVSQSQIQPNQVEALQGEISSMESLDNRTSISLPERLTQQVQAQTLQGESFGDNVMSVSASERQRQPEQVELMQEKTLNVNPDFSSSIPVSLQMQRYPEQVPVLQGERTSIPMCQIQRFPAQGVQMFYNGIVNENTDYRTIPAPRMNFQTNEESGSVNINVNYQLQNGCENNLNNNGLDIGKLPVNTVQTVQYCTGQYRHAGPAPFYMPANFISQQRAMMMEHGRALQTVRVPYVTSRGLQTVQVPYATVFCGSNAGKQSIRFAPYPPQQNQYMLNVQRRNEFQRRITEAYQQKTEMEEKQNRLEKELQNENSEDSKQTKGIEANAENGPTEKNVLENMHENSTAPAQQPQIGGDEQVGFESTHANSEGQSSEQRMLMEQVTDGSVMANVVPAEGLSQPCITLECDIEGKSDCSIFMNPIQYIAVAIT